MMGEDIWRKWREGEIFVSLITTASRASLHSGPAGIMAMAITAGLLLPLPLDTAGRRKATHTALVIDGVWGESKSYEK